MQSNPDIQRSIEAQRDLHATCMKEGHVTAADVGIEIQEPVPDSSMRGVSTPTAMTHPDSETAEAAAYSMNAKSTKKKR